jgi:SpoVK/Ycf46/Vps4 family AAA+-type ATPase
MHCLDYNRGVLGFHQITDTSWNDVILKDNVKNQILDNSINFINNMDEISLSGMIPNRNSILISPPGMAKTTIFRATSNQLNNRCTRVWCTGKSIVYPEHVTALFDAARNLAPCVLFIEDMDLFGGERTMLARDSAVLNEFLAQLDGTQSNSGVIILASTNDMLSMDEALINRPGRFNAKIEIPYPDEEDRSKMLLAFLKDFNASPDPIVTKAAWNNIIELTDGFTGDYIKEVAKTIVIRATAQGRNNNGKITFITDDLNIAGEQVLKNFQIGKRARRHHDISIDGKASIDMAS